MEYNNRPSIDFVVVRYFLVKRVPAFVVFTKSVGCDKEERENEQIREMHLRLQYYVRISLIAQRQIQS